MSSKTKVRYKLPQKINAPLPERQTKDAIFGAVRHKYKHFLMESSTSKEKDRVIAYIDGYNLYFGMVEAEFTSLKWLDIRRLVQSYLKPEQELVAVKYFTSRITYNPDKHKRQTTYLEALETTGVKIYYGKFQDNNVECRRCGNIWTEANE